MVRKNSKSAVENLIREKPMITREEQALLTDPNLIPKFQAEFDKKIVGEEANRLSVFLNACGIFVKNHNPTSYNDCLNANSGAGKDFILKNILKIFPNDMWLWRSRISLTALTYWHSNEPSWTWDGKILVLTDIGWEVLNSDVFKVFCSDETISTITINNRAVDVEVNGKPVVFITTAEGNMKSEMVRRFPIVELDESVSQTKKIKQRQAQYAALGKTTEYNPLFSKILARLEMVNVVVPFAETITEALPDEHIIMRTHFSRFLDYIKASAALHQFQRTRDALGNVIADPADYEVARLVLLATTSNRLMIPLNKKQKQLLDIITRYERPFAVKDIDAMVPFLSQQSLYSYLNKLQEYGFLSSETTAKEGSDKPIRMFKLVAGMALNGIPTYAEICNKIRIALNPLNALNPLITLNAKSNSSNSSNSSHKECHCEFNVNLKCSETECSSHLCTFGSDGKPYCKEHHIPFCSHPIIEEEEV